MNTTKDDSTDKQTILKGKGFFTPGVGKDDVVKKLTVSKDDRRLQFKGRKVDRTWKRTELKARALRIPAAAKYLYKVGFGVYTFRAPRKWAKCSPVGSGGCWCWHLSFNNNVCPSNPASVAGGFVFLLPPLPFEVHDDSGGGVGFLEEALGGERGGEEVLA